MSAPYLIANPPRIRQFRDRRAKVTGLIVIHTAESAPDEVGPDTGTENVARFIRDRTTPGCYHTLVDSDSRLPLVPYDLATYGDGTGSNEFAVHLSFATQAAKWASLGKDWVEGALDQMAIEIKNVIDWFKTKGIEFRLRLVNKAQSDAGWSGLISHALRDPGRRSDPGAGFPWDRLLKKVAALIKPPAPKPAPRPGRADAVAQRRALTKLAAALKPGRLLNKVKAARNRLPKDER